MKKMRLFMLALASCAFFAGCQQDWYEEPVTEGEPPLTYDEEFQIINDYASIDTVNNCYAVAIDDEIMQRERLTAKNVRLILQEFTKFNERLQEEIEEGTVVTLTLQNKHGFTSHTVNGEKSAIHFKDVYAPVADRVQTKANHGALGFGDGNWYDHSISFAASDHVTSRLNVEASSFWSIVMTCSTGTSAYGNKFTMSGTGRRTGVNRYWWWTGGGSAPFNWKFSVSGPVGGRASGSISFSDTY